MNNEIEKLLNSYPLNSYGYLTIKAIIEQVEESQKIHIEDLEYLVKEAREYGEKLSELNRELPHDFNQINIDFEEIKEIN